MEWEYEVLNFQKWTYNKNANFTETSIGIRPGDEGLWTFSLPLTFPMKVKFVYFEIENNLWSDVIPFYLGVRKSQLEFNTVQIVTSK